MLAKDTSYSSMWFNIRFGTYHLQAGPWYMSFKQNQVHVDWRKERPNNWKWFAVYVFFGKHTSNT